MFGKASQDPSASFAVMFQTGAEIKASCCAFGSSHQHPSLALLCFCRLAQQLMHRAEDRLQRYLQRFLNNIILGNPTDSNLQDEDYHILIHEVSTNCNACLLPTFAQIWFRWLHEGFGDRVVHRLALAGLS